MSSHAIRRAARSLVIYLALVAPPAGGLVAIVRAGDRLHAPRSIGGDWLVTRSGTCDRLRSDGPLELDVRQSGPRATATFSDVAATVLEVEIHEDAITGQQPGDACRLVVRAAPPDRAGRLVGTLHWLGCAACADESFVASRKPLAKGAR
jgi:hypothetical protein